MSYEGEVRIIPVGSGVFPTTDSELSAGILGNFKEIRIMKIRNNGIAIIMVMLLAAALSGCSSANKAVEESGAAQ